MIFCKNPSGAPFLFYRRQTVNLPPIQRRAAGGEIYTQSERAHLAAFGGGDAVPTAGELPVFTGGNKRGQDTKYGFLSPLDSPYLPLR